MLYICMYVSVCLSAHPPACLSIRTNHLVRYLLDQFKLLLQVFSCLLINIHKVASQPGCMFPEVTDNDQCKAGLKLLLEKLPAPHNSTLHYLMAHFCRVCQHQDVIGVSDPPVRLLQVFSFILMRPPWEHIM